MDPISLYKKREALRQLLQSKHFAKTKRASCFLEFGLRETFLGNSEKLNEYLIGVEVYERGSDFDPPQVEFFSGWRLPSPRRIGPPKSCSRYMGTFAQRGRSD